MIADSIPALKELTPEQKLTLANELWDEAHSEFDDSPTGAVIEKLLRKRMQEYHDDPESANSWTEFRRKWGMNE